MLKSPPFKQEISRKLSQNDGSYLSCTILHLSAQSCYGLTWWNAHSKGVLHHFGRRTDWLLIISALPVILGLYPQSKIYSADMKQNEQIEGGAFFYFQSSLKQLTAKLSRPGGLWGNGTGWQRAWLWERRPSQGNRTWRNNVPKKSLMWRLCSPQASSSSSSWFFIMLLNWHSRPPRRVSRFLFKWGGNSRKRQVKQGGRKGWFRVILNCSTLQILSVCLCSFYFFQSFLVAWEKGREKTISNQL